jgi:hypothetical protein
MTMAWEWSVYPRLSSNPIVAAGITDEPDRARCEVELALGADEGAGWGMLQQVRLSVGEPSDGGCPLERWPAASCLPLMCRRDGRGGFVWHRVNPVTA